MEPREIRGVPSYRGSSRSFHGHPAGRRAEQDRATVGEAGKQRPVGVPRKERGGTGGQNRAAGPGSGLRSDRRRRKRGKVYTQARTRNGERCTRKYVSESSGGAASRAPRRLRRAGFRAPESCGEHRRGPRHCWTPHAHLSCSSWLPFRRIAGAALGHTRRPAHSSADVRVFCSHQACPCKQTTRGKCGPFAGGSVGRPEASAVT